MIVVPVPAPAPVYFEYFVAPVTNNPPIQPGQTGLDANFLSIDQLRAEAPSISRLQGFIYVRSWCKIQQGSLSMAGSIGIDNQLRSVNPKDVQFINDQIRKSSRTPSRLTV